MKSNGKRETAFTFYLYYSSDSAVQACYCLLVFYEDKLARIKTEASSLFD